MFPFFVAMWPLKKLAVFCVVWLGIMLTKCCCAKCATKCGTKFDNIQTRARAKLVFKEMDGFDMASMYTLDDVCDVIETMPDKGEDMDALMEKLYGVTKARGMQVLKKTKMLGGVLRSYTFEGICDAIEASPDKGEDIDMLTEKLLKDIHDSVRTWDNWDASSKVDGPGKKTKDIIVGSNVPNQSPSNLKKLSNLKMTGDSGDRNWDSSLLRKQTTETKTKPLGSTKVVPVILLQQPIETSAPPVTNSYTRKDLKRIKKQFGVKSDEYKSALNEMAKQRQRQKTTGA